MQLVEEPRTELTTASRSVRALVDGFDDSLRRVADDVATTGSACLHDVVDADWLAAARTFVTGSVDMDGSRERFIEGFADDPDSFAHQLITDDRLEPFLHSVATAGLPSLEHGRHPIENELRLVRSPSRPGGPLWFHFDATAITMVVPILIPTSTPGRSGELVLCPNRRPFRRSVLANIVEKLVTQNDVYRRFFAARRRDGATASMVPLEPGNAYVFSGYRSYHATMPCPPDTLRVTLILHYGDVHGRSRLLATARSLNRTIRQLGRRASS